MHRHPRVARQNYAPPSSPIVAGRTSNSRHHVPAARRADPAPSANTTTVQRRVHFSADNYLSRKSLPYALRNLPCNSSFTPWPRGNGLRRPAAVSEATRPPPCRPRPIVRPACSGPPSALHRHRRELHMELVTTARRITMKPLPSTICPLRSRVRMQTGESDQSAPTYMHKDIQGRPITSTSSLFSRVYAA